MIPVSVCIITKNEADKMEEFLKRLRPYDWEIVVVDTGSTDGTREIAAKYADVLLDFEWIEDFSAARNFSIEHASNDYILVMDCDEFVINIDIEGILELMNRHPEEVGCLARNNHFISNYTDTVSTDYPERLFSRSLFHYVSPIHEQLVRKDGTLSPCYQLPLTVDHFGYLLDEEKTRAKAKRDNDLLFKELEKNPNDQYVLFQIGQSFNFLAEHESSYSYYKRAMAFPLNNELEYHHALVIAYGYSMLYTNRLTEAMEMFQLYDAFGESADFHCLMGDIYMRNNYPLKAMLEYINATSCSLTFVQGSNSMIPTYNIARINELLGDYDSAIMHYRRCGDFPMALEKIRILTELLNEKK